MPLVSGTTLGHYEILSPLGAGGMGEVYRARDTRLNRDVAIKVLAGLLSDDPDHMLRFELEARAAAALNHPNILAVFQMGTYARVPYMVTELLEGTTLEEAIRRGPLPFRKVIDYGVQVAHGLAAAHEKGIIHRDLKPENLFITKDGRVKILDFGLAKLTQPKQPSDRSPTLTRPGVVLGTKGYMAPEQVRGLEIDYRADIFAFGAILYEMVMGRQTFQRPTSADTMSAILNEEPAPISQLAPDTPVALEKVIRRCLEKNAEQRFQSASDLAFALQALSDPALSSITAASEIKSLSRSWLRPVWVAAALAGVLVAAVVSYVSMRPPSVPTLANYAQLTHDGQPKSLIGTDGARLYLGLGVGGSGSFVMRGVAEMSISGGELRRIAMPSADMAAINVSPDGSQLLVIDGQGAPPTGPLWSVSTEGGSPRRLGDAVGETAAWSRDGNLMAYSRLGDLFVAKADGTESRKLIAVRGDIKNIVWSPDNRSLRFDTTETAGTLGQRLIWEVSADGSKLHRLLAGWHDPPDECCGKWTADGTYFLFQSHEQIWALPGKTDFRRAGVFRSETEPIPLSSSPLSLSSPLPGKDGKKLFVVGQTYRGELVRYDSQSGQFAPFLGGISAEYVAFSKDGAWVTYVLYREGTLWRSRLDGSERLQLTYPPSDAVLPRWSPDGKNILFFEFAGGANKPARIYEVSVGGGSPRQLLPDDREQQMDPNWSPDGSKIVFAGESNNPASLIRILDLASHKVSNLPDSQGLFSPRWSPDGHFISAFSSDSTQLLLFDLQTQKWTKLASGSLSWLNWSHDGQYVYVLDFRDKDAVVRIRIRDHAIERVADLGNLLTAGRYGGSLALTPDDSPLLLRDTGSQDVYSVDWQSPN